MMTNEEDERRYMKMIYEIINNNVNIVEQFEIKMKKDKNQEQKEHKDNSFLIQQYSDYPIKQSSDFHMPSDEEYKGALNLIPLKKKE